MEDTPIVGYRGRSTPDRHKDIQETLPFNSILKNIYKLK